MRKASVFIAAATVAALLAPTAVAQLDNALPGGMIFRDNHATCQSPVTANISGDPEVAWVFDTKATWGIIGLRMHLGICFDEADNLYIRSFDYWGNMNRLYSLDSDGNLRWIFPPTATDPNDLPSTGEGQRLSPIVGTDAVYLCLGYNTDVDPYVPPTVYAINKSTGVPIWTTELTCPNVGQWSSMPNFTLLDGVLYLIGIEQDGTGTRNVYALEAATGAILVNVTLNIPHDDGAGLGDGGNIVAVADAFGPGVTGLYGYVQSIVYGIEVVLPPPYGPGPASASVAWTASVGSAGWWQKFHTMYNEQTDQVLLASSELVIDPNYAPEVYALDPVAGDIGYTWGDAGHLNYWGEGAMSGHMPNAAIDFGGDRLFTGSTQAGVLHYACTAGTGAGDGGVTAVYDGADQPIGLEPSYPGSVSTVVQDGEGKTLYITALQDNSVFQPAIVVVVDVDEDDAGVWPQPPEGPMYVDDVTLYTATDPNDPLTWTVQFSEDFEGLNLGGLDTQGNWTTTGTPAPQVIADPTGGGQGQVCAMDPEPGTGNVVIENLFTPDDAQIYVIEYSKWMSSNLDGYQVQLGADNPDPNDPMPTVPFHSYDDMGARVTAIEWAVTFIDRTSQPNVIDSDTWIFPEQWETVQVAHRYDWATSQVIILPGLDPNLFLPSEFPTDPNGVPFQTSYRRGTATWPIGDWQPTTKPDGVKIEMWTSVGDWHQEYGWSSQPSPAVLAQFTVPSRDGWMGHYVGCPTLGPDGKLYAGTSDEGTKRCPDEWFAVIFALDLGEECLCGDVNGDGVVDTQDIDGFVYCVVNNLPWWENPSCSLEAADTNKDGSVDTVDIDDFVYAVVNGVCP